MKCIACKAHVGSGGDRHTGVRIEYGIPQAGIGCSVRGKIGDRGHSLLAPRKESGAEKTIIFNQRGVTQKVIKGGKHKGNAEKK